MLTNVTIYWLTGTGASSARIYYENMHSGSGAPPGTVPTGVATFAEDGAIRRYGEQGNNIVHWSDFEGGGPFRRAGGARPAGRRGARVLPRVA